MKRIFTIITILISLSLVGIIVLQVSWIKNALLIKEEQLYNNITISVAKTATELEDEKSKFPAVISPKMMTNWPKDRMFNLFRAPTIAQRYSAISMQEKIRSGFEKFGLRNTHFEFAIVNANSDFGYEMQSARFEQGYDQALNDSVNNWIFYYPINAFSGSETENLSPDETLILVITNFRSYIFRSLGWMVSGAILFTIIILAAFYLTVNTLLRQKKLSEIKSDFINNMTHELKTPLATISLAIDAIKNPKVFTDHTKLDYFSSVIKEENKRMNKQVERILQEAMLDRQEVKLELKRLPINDIVTAVANSFTLQMQEKNGTMHLDLLANSDTMEGDEIHINNLLRNLIENAIKYSKDDVPIQLEISTKNVGKNIVIKIADNGIGMNKETISRIFEKFYRAHTGNVHNVKGFGLGLSYVKSMTKAHHGKIKVESVLGKGSVFTVEFPLATV
jgi:two-component system phosphate regulon sensor histidine kinase PhoR